MNREKIEAAVRNYVKAYGIDNICRDDVIRYIEATGCSVSQVTADSITVAFPGTGETTLTGYVYSNQNVKDSSAVPVVFGLCGVVAGFTSVLFAWLINWSCIPVSKHDTALMVVQLATSFLESASLILLGVSLLIAGGKRVHERHFCAGHSLFKGKAGGSNAA